MTGGFHLWWYVPTFWLLWIAGVALFGVVALVEPRPGVWSAITSLGMVVAGTLMAMLYLRIGRRDRDELLADALRVTEGQALPVDAAP